MSIRGTFATPSGVALDTGTAQRISTVTDALARTPPIDDEAGYRVFARLSALQREDGGALSQRHAQRIARALVALGLATDRVAAWYVRFEQAHHLDGSAQAPHRTAACIGTALWLTTEPHVKPPVDHAGAAWLLRELFNAMVDLGLDAVTLDDLLSARRTFRELVQTGPTRLDLGGGV